MSQKQTGKTTSKKSPKRRREYSDLTMIIMVILVLVVAIVGGNIIKSRQAARVIPPPDETQIRQFAAAPPMTIDTAKQYLATVKMEKGGEFVIALHADKAPVTVNNFVFLAREGFYDGVTFHRVLEGFMAQTGDPTGTGRGGPGYQFDNEDSDLVFDRAGVVAMANAGRDTNGSQFFITFVPTEQLNGGYTIFGQVISGMEVVNGITRRNPQRNPDFTGDVITSITISEE